MKRETKNWPVATDFPQGVPQSVVDAVQALYVACGNRRVTWPLNACTGCCMDAQLAREMCDWSLRTVTQKHIYQYQDAAHEAVQDADEYLHFLPRVAELISQGDAGVVRHSTEIALERLGGFDHTALHTDEKHAIDTWSQALWQWWLDADRCGHAPPLLFESADTLLVMFANAGLPLEPFLARWQLSGTNWAAAQFGVLLADMEQHGACINAFAKKLPDVSETIRAWAFHSDVYMHFAERWEQMSDAEASENLYENPYVEASVVAALGPRAPS